jgi:predicted  nucleic acid-binding Zn-ribbon protein
MNSDEDELLRITNEINKNTKKENKLIDIISNLDGQLDSIGKNRKEYYLKLEKRKKNIEEVNEEIKNSINNISKNHSYKISLTEMSPKKLNTYRENYSKTLSNEYTVLLEHKNEELEETIMRKDNEIKELTKKFQAVNEKCKKLQKIKK